MSERVDIDLREAKPRAGSEGLVGLLHAFFVWLKSHLPLVIKPVEYAEKRIDQERARTRLIDAQARILEAEARRRELENEEFSTRGTAISTKLATHLLEGLGSMAREKEIATLDQAGEALLIAAERLEALGIDVQVSLIQVSQSLGEPNPQPSTAVSPITPLDYETSDE